MLEQAQRLKSYAPRLDVGNREFTKAIMQHLEQQIAILKDVLELQSQRPPSIPVYESGEVG
jgi:hypothetical protein